VDEITIPLSFPLDDDGFLRRSCPACRREWKWQAALPQQPGQTKAQAESNICPYCGQRAAVQEWLTTDQRVYIEGSARPHAIAAVHDALSDIFRGLNGGGVLRVTADEPALPPVPPQLTETNDMVRIDVPCHPDELFKVDDVWSEGVYCIVCGTPYPQEQVHVLPKS